MSLTAPRRLGRHNDGRERRAPKYYHPTTLRYFHIFVELRLLREAAA